MNKLVHFLCGKDLVIIPAVVVIVTVVVVAALSVEDRVTAANIIAGRESSHRHEGAHAQNERHQENRDSFDASHDVCLGASLVPPLLSF